MQIIKVNIWNLCNLFFYVSVLVIIFIFWGTHTKKEANKKRQRLSPLGFLRCCRLFLCVFHLMFNLTYPSRQLMGRLRFVRVSALLVCGGGGSPTSQWGKAWQSWRHLLWATVGWGFKRRQTQPVMETAQAVWIYFPVLGIVCLPAEKALAFHLFSPHVWI